MLFTLVGLVPLLVILAVSFGVCRSFYDTHNAVLGLVLVQALVWVIVRPALSLLVLALMRYDQTDALKLTVGRPRPDLIDRCRPMAGAANAVPYGLVTSAICTRTNLLKDGLCVRKHLYNP